MKRIIVLFIITSVMFMPSKLYAFSFDDENCAFCDGEGKVECSHCYGYYNSVCSVCSGSGKTACAMCYGSGLFSAGGVTIGCTFCGGNRFYRGSGANRCQSCFGQGTKNCNYCYKGKSSCSHCGGTGWNAEKRRRMNEISAMSSQYYGGNYGGSINTYSGSTGSYGGYSNSSSTSNDGGPARKQCRSCEIPGNGNCRACKGMGLVSSGFSLDQVPCATCHGNKKCVYCNGSGWQ